MDVIDFLCASLDSSTIQLYESLGSRHACSCLEAGFSSQNYDRASGCTTEEQSSITSFCGQKNSVQRIFLKKYFLFTVGSVYCVKGFTTGSRNYLNDVRKLQMMLDQVRKWLRQQSKTSVPQLLMYW
jgi:hypothetical protein